MPKIKLFINQYQWKETKFSTEPEDWKKFESNNISIALNVRLLPNDNEEIKQAYISKYNSNRENKEIFLIITDGKKWHYLKQWCLLLY